MSDSAVTIDGHAIKPLTPETWPEFDALVERHNGIFGGCWCAYFHCHPQDKEGRGGLSSRDFKKKMVDDGVAHAALVFDGDEAVAWAEYGTVEELPNIQHRKQWEAESTRQPDYRITCVFVDKRYRRHGMAAVAVQGAVALIARQGGGRLEAYPHDVPPEKKMSSSFLYNGTRTMYERLGWTYDRPKGMGNCVMVLDVAAGDGPTTVPQKEPTAGQGPQEPASAPASKPSATKAAVKKATTKTTPKKVSAKKTVGTSAAAKTAAKRSAAKKAPANESEAKKTAVKKAPADKSEAKKTAAKKAPANKSVAKKTAAEKAASSD